jgi:hypothetical protein
MRAHVLVILIERLSLLWVERELCSYPLKPFSGARRQRGTLNADPQSTGDKTQIQQQG